MRRLHHYTPRQCILTKISGQKRGDGLDKAMRLQTIENKITVILKNKEVKQ